MNRTQRIPNLLAGISQQPDNRKRPGQVRDAKNVFPDYALGMLKRPGGEFVAQLHDASPSTNNKWFSILREGTEKFVGTFSDNKFHIWSIIDQQPRAVEMGTHAGQQSSCVMADLTTAADNLRLNFATRLTAQTTLRTESGDLAEDIDNSVNQETSSFAITNTYEDQLESTVTSGITKNADGEYIVYKDGQVLVEATTTLPSTFLRVVDGGLLLANGELTNQSTTTSNFLDNLATGVLTTQTTDTDVATTTDGSGTSMTVDVTVNNNKVVKAVINTAGSGYVDGDTITITGYDNTTVRFRSPTGKTVDLTTTNGSVVAARTNAAGSNYINGDQLTVSLTNTQGDPETVLLEETGCSLGTERTDEYPTIASKGLRLYELVETTNPTVTSEGVETAEDDYTTDLTAYNTQVDEPGGSPGGQKQRLATWDAANTLCDIANSEVPANAYLDSPSAEDLEYLTINDTTLVLNRSVTPAMDSTDTAPAEVKRACVVVSIANRDTTYKADATQDGVSSTPGTKTVGSGHNETLTPQLIAENLANDIDGENGYTAVAKNGVIDITRSGTGTIDIKTSGGLSEGAIYGFSDTISNVSFLPNSCVHGYIVKVINSNDIDIDDMYLKFVADDGVRGWGHWAETIKPGEEESLDAATMPHKLTKQADGSFKYEPVGWNERKIGDDNTNPNPNFVGEKITCMFFYRNRLGLVAGDRIALSRSNDLFNFFTTTARTAVDDDPIYITTSSGTPARITHAVTTQIGVVLYSDTEQFLLTTDSDVLSPSTVRLKTLCNYDASDDVTPVALGTSHGFITKTPQTSKFFELVDINTEQPPILNDTTVNVPELLPNEIDLIASSADLSLAVFGEKGKRDLYFFRFYNQSREKRLIQTWFKWETTGDVLDIFFDRGALFAVTTNGTNVAVQQFDMSQSNEQGFLTLTTGEKTDVCLDMFDANPHRTYNATDDETTIQLPYDHVENNGTFTVIALGGYLGNTITAASSSTVGAVLQPTVDTSNNTCVIDGDYRGLNLVIGYTYDMQVDLPTMYVFQQVEDNVRYEENADLIIHRLKMSTGLSGPVDYEIKIDGIDDFNNTITVTKPYEYELNSVNMQNQAIHEVPIYQRNQNVNLSVKSTGPFPVSLLGYDWEGKYNNKFYRR